MVEVPGGEQTEERREDRTNRFSCRGFVCVCVLEVLLSKEREYTASRFYVASVPQGRRKLTVRLRTLG